LEVATFAALLDGQEFDDALFDIVEPGMVRIQDAARLGDVEAILGLLAPGQLEHPVKVVADPALLGVLLAGALESLELTLDLLAHVVRKGRVGDFLAILGQGIAVGVAQLLLDRGQLLTQVELALAFFQSFVDLNADLVFQRGLGQNLPTPGDQLLETRDDIAFFEDFEMLVQFEIGRVAGHVGELARVVDPTQHLAIAEAPRRSSRFSKWRGVPARSARLAEARSGRRRRGSTVIHNALHARSRRY
jgi:hypothetical protein